MLISEGCNHSTFSEIPNAPNFFIKFAPYTVTKPLKEKDLFYYFQWSKNVYLLTFLLGYAGKIIYNILQFNIFIYIMKMFFLNYFFKINLILIEF